MAAIPTSRFWRQCCDLSIAGGLVKESGTMRDAAKTKKQLIDELQELRCQNDELEKSLKQALDRQRYADNLINSSLDMIISVDEDRRIVEFSRAAEKTFGYSRDELMGRHVDILYSNPAEGLAVHNQTRLLGRFTGEIINRRKNGETFPSLISTSVICDVQGRTMGFMGISRDLSDLRRTEEALAEYERELRESIFRNRIVRLEKMSSVIGLSVNLIHEISNPMDGTIRYMRLLLDQIHEDDSRRKYVEQALAGLARIREKVVGGLRQLAQGATPMFRTVGIPQVLDGLLSSLSEQIAAQNISVEREFHGDIPSFFNADVEEIFRNIMKNAIQAMPDGGKLSIGARMVSPELLEVRISDTGTGIPDVIKERIFEAFFTTREIGEGTGLGLCISQAIAESYNGSIDVESELGSGTTFIITLPVSEDGLTISDTES